MFSFAFTITVLAIISLTLVFLGLFVAVMALLVWHAERQEQSSH